MKKLAIILGAILTASASAQISQPGGGGVSVTSSTSDLTLSPSPLTGTGTIDLNLANANNWSANASFPTVNIGATGTPAIGAVQVTQSSGPAFTTFPAYTGALGYINGAGAAGFGLLLGDTNANSAVLIQNNSNGNFYIDNLTNTTASIIATINKTNGGYSASGGGSFQGGGVSGNTQLSAVTIESGYDGTTTSAIGALTLRGANNSNASGTSASSIFEPGAETGGGSQGTALMNESSTTASVLSATFEVVSQTTTADQVAATALGALTGVVGIAQTAGGTATQLYVASYGKTNVRFDGTPVIGDTACAPPPTTGTAGLAHDNGTTACTTSSLVGVVTGQVSGTGSGATATVLLKLQ
jgi:hypothetical protein